MCAHDNQSQDNGSYYVPRNAIRSDVQYSRINSSYGDYQDA